MYIVVGVSALVVGLFILMYYSLNEKYVKFGNLGKSRIPLGHTIRVKKSVVRDPKTLKYRNHRYERLRVRRD